MKKLIIPAAALVIIGVSLIAAPALGKTLNNPRNTGLAAGSGCCGACQPAGQPAAAADAPDALPPCCTTSVVSPPETVPADSTAPADCCD